MIVAGAKLASDRDLAIRVERFAAHIFRDDADRVRAQEIVYGHYNDITLWVQGDVRAKAVVSGDHAIEAFGRVRARVRLDENDVRKGRGPLVVSDRDEIFELLRRGAPYLRSSR